MEETGGSGGHIEVQAVGLEVGTRADKVVTVQEIADVPVVGGKVGDG